MKKMNNNLSKDIKKIYCGGTFCFDFKEDDYYEKAKNDYRSIILGSEKLLLEKHDYVKLSDNLRYIGPFYFETEGMIDELIVEQEINMVKDCTHAIFLLDSGCCPGTIAELTLASQLKKNVEIFYVQKNNNEETESRLHTPCWFAIIASKLINDNTNLHECNSNDDAIKKIRKLVKEMK